MPTKDATSAEVFHRLHAQGLLVLANVWDAGSARLVESLGAKALATTSAGVAWSHGYADGDLLPVPLLAATVADIARVVSVPLSVDAEGGYANDPATVGETVARLIDAGAVGINLEDGTGEPDLLCAKIEAVKRASARLGVDLFVNARTDVYLLGLVTEARRVGEMLARAERYRAAGADGIFVPAIVDPAEIRAITSAVPLPVNVLALRGLPAAAELQALGVRRLSAGSGMARATLGRIAQMAKDFLRNGASEAVAGQGMTYDEINALMAAR
ncbi:MAG TPA: isocitrate lyase/phosphoenolpyruvate mutase family protein [Candidatus Limnocylindria bacterium]|nr:isocitrate lyase/phosphoenolpyruvate mutase family protein [Candidatus Limnocylindria bacterium]